MMDVGGLINAGHEARGGIVEGSRYQDLRDAGARLRR